MRVAEYIFSKLWWYLFENYDWKDAWEEIEGKYLESFRSYHSVDHIEEMMLYLWEADWPRNAEGEKQKYAAILAAAFHDFQNPRDKWAERMSATWLQLWMLGWAQENEPVDLPTFWWIFEHCAEAVAETETHSSTSLVGQMLIDADLRRFITGYWQEWARQIREEYSEYSDEDFNAGRMEVLKKFRARSPFFYLAQHDDCEAYRRLDEQIAALEISNGLKSPAPG